MTGGKGLCGDGTAYTAYTLILPDVVIVKITIPVTKLAINDNACVLAVGHIYDPLRQKAILLYSFIMRSSTP